MANYRNNGWEYYSLVHQIILQGAGTQAIQDIGSEADIEPGETDPSALSNVPFASDGE